MKESAVAWEARIDNIERTTVNWKPVTISLAFFLLVQLQKQFANPLLNQIVAVVLYTLLALIAIGGLHYIIWERKRREPPPLPRTWLVPVSERITVDDGWLSREERESGKVVWFSRVKVRLDEIWGVKEIGDKIKVIRRPMYQTAFIFSSACFPTEEEKERFYSILEERGAKIIRKQSSTLAS